MTGRACMTCGREAAPGSSRCTNHTKDMHYNAPHWRSVRTSRLIHDSYTCQLRHPGCTNQATSVHLHPSLNGDHRRATLANTLSACHRCHGIEDAPRAQGHPATSQR